VGMSGPTSNPERRHEERDMNVNAVALFAVSLAVTLIIIHYLAVAMFHHLASRPAKYPPPSPLAASRENFAGPRLLVDQALEMKKLRTAEESLLHGYDWVDRDHGIVRIPIDRAIELLAQRGVPTNDVEQGSQP
jgi:hypothetical protein